MFQHQQPSFFNENFFIPVTRGNRKSIARVSDRLNLPEHYDNNVSNDRCRPSRHPKNFDQNPVSISE